MQIRVYTAGRLLKVSADLCLSSRFMAKTLCTGHGWRKTKDFCLVWFLFFCLRHLCPVHEIYAISAVFSLACSAGVFFERAICSRKRHVETSPREEEMG